MVRAEQHLAASQHPVFAGGGVVVRQRDQFKAAQRTARAIARDELCVRAAKIAIYARAAVVERVLRRDAGFLQHLIQCLAHLRDGVVRELPRLAQPEGDVLLARVARFEGVVRAEIQTRRGAEHDEHHRRQNADRGKPRAVALHAVGHGRDGDEMVRAVIIPPVLLQRAAQHDRAADEQQERCENDQQHRDEEPEQRAHGIGDCDGDVIRRTQQSHAEHAQQPVCPGRLFARALAAQQRDRRGKAHLPQGVQKQQRENDGKHDRRARERRDADGERERYAALQELQQRQLHELGKQHAQRQPRRQRDEGGDERLPEQNYADVALFHAENIIKPKFLFAPPDEKRVGVKQENAGEHRDDPTAELHRHARRVAAARGIDERALREERDDVEHGDHADAGEDVGRVEALIFADAVHRQLWEKFQLHARSPPVVSMVSVSAIFW